ncbi:unnamed protein product [Gongylonema pulchrum]|uniref:OMP_b-brl domain-containing protein n=1 Tax=Gongylonema pulchrum TaxID=637853 RepID=A0A183CYP7_9BILA|nr:unnamed protein product [Gongylonema pulchrum]
MIPTFPSKTFPNHYTIATGLYPPWNGIIDNYFYDFSFKEYFQTKTNRTGWYLGEPIWNTVQKYGLKSATYFWPGSESPVNGIGLQINLQYRFKFPLSVCLF